MPDTDRSGQHISRSLVSLRFLSVIPTSHSIVLNRILIWQRLWLNYLVQKEYKYSIICRIFGKVYFVFFNLIIYPIIRLAAAYPQFNCSSININGEARHQPATGVIEYTVSQSVQIVFSYGSWQWTMQTKWLLLAYLAPEFLEDLPSGCLWTSCLHHSHISFT